MKNSEEVVTNNNGDIELDDIDILIIGFIVGASLIALLR